MSAAVERRRAESAEMFWRLAAEEASKYKHAAREAQARVAALERCVQAIDRAYDEIVTERAALAAQLAEAQAERDEFRRQYETMGAALNQYANRLAVLEALAQAVRSHDCNFIAECEHCTAIRDALAAVAATEGL